MSKLLTKLQAKFGGSIFARGKAPKSNGPSPKALAQGVQGNAPPPSAGQTMGSTSNANAPRALGAGASALLGR